MTARSLVAFGARPFGREGFLGSMPTAENTEALMGNVKEPIADLDMSPQHVNELSAMTDEFGPLYQAAHDADYYSGKKDGYRLGYGAGYRDGRKHENDSIAATAGILKSTEQIRPHRRLLLGLPCMNCGVYFYSDEEQIKP